MIRGLALGIAAVILLGFAAQDNVFNFLDLAGYALLAVAVLLLSTTRSRRVKR